jgi:hypothetical protein
VKKGPTGGKSNKSFRKKRSINLRNSSLKKRIIIGGGVGDSDEYNKWEKKKNEDESFQKLDDVKKKTMFFNESNSKGADAKVSTESAEVKDAVDTTTPANADATADANAEKYAYLKGNR